MDAGSTAEITNNFVSGSIGELASESTAPAVGSATVDFVARMPQLGLTLFSGSLETLGL